MLPHIIEATVYSAPRGRIFHVAFLCFTKIVVLAPLSDTYTNTSIGSVACSACCTHTAAHQINYVTSLLGIDYCIKISRTRMRWGTPLYSSNSYKTRSITHLCITEKARSSSTCRKIQETSDSKQDMKQEGALLLPQERPC